MTIATRPPCTLTAAKVAIVRTHARIKSDAVETVPVDPARADRVVCAGDTMGVTIASGGTAGDVGFVLFRRTLTGWRVALAENGYKIGLFRLGDDVAASQPVYRKNDPNCCPSGGFDHVRYHWNGSRFVVARSWHTRSFRP